MYSREDICSAKTRLRKCTLALLAVLFVLLAVYIAGIIARKQGLMLAALLLGFVWLMLAGDLIWLPAKRYAGFLCEMESGLRRSVLCIPERIETEDQMQDGVRVRALHVRLADGKDSRIYYINVSKLHCLPPMGQAVQLTSFGRHVVNCEAVTE